VCINANLLKFSSRKQQQTHLLKRTSHIHTYPWYACKYTYIRIVISIIFFSPRNPKDLGSCTSLHARNPPRVEGNLYESNLLHCRDQCHWERYNVIARSWQKPWSYNTNARRTRHDSKTSCPHFLLQLNEEKWRNNLPNQAPVMSTVKSAWPDPLGSAPNSSAKMGRLCENQVQLHWHQTHPQKKDCSHLTHHAQPLQQTSTPPDRWIVLLKCGEFFWTLVLDAHHSITWTFWDSFTNSFQFYKSHCIS